MNLAKIREQVQALEEAPRTSKDMLIRKWDVLAILGEENTQYRRVIHNREPRDIDHEYRVSNERKGQRREVSKRRRYDGLTMAIGTQLLHYTRRHAGEGRRTNG